MNIIRRKDVQTVLRKSSHAFLNNKYKIYFAFKFKFLSIHMNEKVIKVCVFESNHAIAIIFVDKSGEIIWDNYLRFVFTCLMCSHKNG